MMFKKVMMILMVVTLAICTACAEAQPRKSATAVVKEATPLPELKREYVGSAQFDIGGMPASLDIWLPPVQLKEQTTAGLYDFLKTLYDKYVANGVTYISPVDGKERGVGDFQFHFTMAGDPTNTEFTLSFYFSAVINETSRKAGAIVLNCYNHGAGTDSTRWDVPWFKRHPGAVHSYDGLAINDFAVTRILSELHQIESVCKLTRAMVPYEPELECYATIIKAGTVSLQPILVNGKWVDDVCLVDKPGSEGYYCLDWYKDETEWHGNANITHMVEFANTHFYKYLDKNPKDAKKWGFVRSGKIWKKKPVKVQN